MGVITPHRGDHFQKTGRHQPRLIGYESCSRSAECRKGGKWLLEFGLASEVQLFDHHTLFVAPLLRFLPEPLCTIRLVLSLSGRVIALPMVFITENRHRAGSLKVAQQTGGSYLGNPMDQSMHAPLFLHLLLVQYSTSGTCFKERLGAHYNKVWYRQQSYHSTMSP